MGKEYEDRILKRLDALITILLNSEIGKANTIQKVRILKKVGLDYKEIANILNTSPNSVSVMFAKINKEK